MRTLTLILAFFFTFSTVPSPGFSAEAKINRPKPPAKAEARKSLARIDIKKLAMESEEKGIIPSATPLMVLVDVNASEDVAGPFAVALELKKGKDKQNFKENVEKLNKGLNTFKWKLAEKPEDGAYSLSVEISGQEPKQKDKATQSFKVGEKTKKPEVPSKEKPVEKTEVKPDAKPESKAKTEPKKSLAKIDIKKLALESEEKNVVPSGSPLMALAEIHASEDIAGPFAVNLELKKGKNKQSFKEGIEKLSKGANSFKWALTGKPEEGPYVLTVEIAGREPKLKDKATKSFRVGGNKKKPEISAEGKTEKASEAKPQASQSKTAKSGGGKKAEGGTETVEGKDGGKEDGKEEDKDEGNGKPDFGLVGGDEEDKDTTDITVTGQSVKKLTIAGITLNGHFIQQSPGVYLAQGEVKPEGFPISLGKAAGELKIDKNKDRIEGQMYISVIGLGKLVQITDLILSKTQIKFKGKFNEKVTIPVIHAEISLAEGVADFEVSSHRFACQANGGVIIGVSIPKVGTVSFEVVSGEEGFATSIPPEGISVSGAGTVTIPFEPPIKVKLEGSAEITKKSVTGKGSATLFSILEVGNGDFDIDYGGIMKINTNAGLFLSDYGLEANLADTDLTIDLPKKQLTAAMKQNLKILDLITIPGSVKGDLLIDGKAKLLSVSGTAKVPLTGTAMGPEQISAGIQDFVIKIANYDSKSPNVELNGELAISVWTLGGFNGKIANAILDGKGNFFLPPGLKQLLDLEKVSLPVRVDLKSARILGDLGGEVAGLAIKHFPVEGPKLVIKNDGVHLMGQIGIANVITIPLGDLVFTQSNSYTTINGDIGIGPFTVAEGNFTLPSGANDGIGFSGKMGIPGLSGQKLSGTVYKDGKVELSGVTKLGFITVDTLSRFDVSKTGLHADKAGFSVGLGGAAKCGLAFSSLDINQSMISGRATGTFTGVLGVKAALKGDFSFDGETVELSYPDAVELCGISVREAKLRVNKNGATGSGNITAAGQSKNISITIENGVMKLKGPAGELIAEGMRIADQLADTVGDIASEEKKVVEEDANGTLENLSRLSEPWIKEAVAAARVAKNIFSTIEKIVVDEITAQTKAALEDLKKAVDAAVLFAKNAIAAAVDAVCNGIIALVDGVKAIFGQIESRIPADYLDAYNKVKNKVIEKGNAVKTAVVAFRDNTKASLYNVTGTITAIYQNAIDGVTGKANEIASGVKKELDPAIKEIDLLLTEIGQEIDAATTAAGDEAERHYNTAKQKAGLLKRKSDDITAKYKEKAGDLVAPYLKPVKDRIESEKAKVTKTRDEAIARGIEGLATAKKTLDPVIKPFEDAVKELRDLTNRIGGAVYQKFLDGVGAAGSALDTALGNAGKGLVKATDLVGDAAVAVSGAAADASETAHDAAVATVNFVQDTGSQAVNVAVDTAQEGYQTATQAANQAAAEAQQAASQAYQTATQAASNAKQQVTSTVNNAINNLPPVSPSSFATGTPVKFSDLQSGAQTISAKVNGILNSLDSYANSAYNSASSAASSVGSAISGGASSVASGLSSGWKTATGGISNLFGGSSGSPAPTLDYTSPEVTNIAATSATNSITVTWNTSFDSRTLLFYSATPNVNLRGQDAVTKVASIHTGDNYPETTNHSITVTGLNSGTAYYYVVYAVHAMSGGATTNAAKKGPYRVVTQPSTAIIGGSVKDSGGSPIPGAKIYIGQATAPVATTDATGRFTLEVNPGVQTVTAKKDNYLSASTTTPNLAAGQILPLDFALADGRIQVSGTVKDVGTNAGVSAATVTFTGLPTAITVPTDANGAFTTALAPPSSGSLQFSMSVSKAGYTTYTSGPITLAPGAKMQNVEIKLPHVPPAVNADGVDVGPVTATQATVFFATTANCSAFVQLGPQSVPGYAYQTPAQSNKNSFSFNLVGLTPATTYKYKAVLQDSFGNTVVAAEDTFTTASAVSAATDIGLNATISNISGNSAKLNVTSATKTLKHQLVLKDTTANKQISNQDLGLLVSPVSLDLKNLTDGHNYTADLTGSLLANVTSGNVIKTATKSVNFQTPALKPIVIQSLDVTPASVKRGTAAVVNVAVAVRVNHAISNAVLKVSAGNKDLCLKNLNNLSPGKMQIAVPLQVNTIPGNGNVAIKIKIQAAGNIEESSAKTIEIFRPQEQGGGGQSQNQGAGTRPKPI